MNTLPQLLFVFGSLTLGLTTSNAQSTLSLVTQTKVLPEYTTSTTQADVVEKVSYGDWEVLLKKNVSREGIVDYKGFRDDQAKFDMFLKDLAKVRINSSWTRNDKIAFWINVYNAYTVKLITKNYPVESIKQINDPWKVKFFNVNGRLMNLSEVEHEILRGFDDARIHFAINCASASCPRLIQVPYTASNVERLLDRQTREFINDPFYNTITGYTVNVSKLFDWYKKDFKKQSNGSVVDFINKYSEVKIADQKEKGYKPYDWSINSKE